MVVVFLCLSPLSLNSFHMGVWKIAKFCSPINTFQINMAPRCFGLANQRNFHLGASWTPVGLRWLMVPLESFDWWNIEQSSQGICVPSIDDDRRRLRISRDRWMAGPRDRDYDDDVTGCWTLGLLKSGSRSMKAVDKWEPPREVMWHNHDRSENDRRAAPPSIVTLPPRREGKAFS